MKYVVRAMVEKDLVNGLQLSEMSGWNQKYGDWRFLFDLPNGNHWVVERNSRVVATLMCISHGPKLGWIAMVLVHPAHRRKKLATRLLNQVFISNASIAYYLDATSQGSQVYKTLDFMPFSSYERLTLDLEQKNVRVLIASEQVTALSKDMMPLVLEKDLTWFGADRSVILERLFTIYPKRCWVVKNHEEVIGYCFGRPGRNFDQIGPVVSQDVAVARSLVAHACNATQRVPLVIDIHSDRHQVKQFLQDVGFVRQRSFVRMCKGSMQKMSDHAIIASAGPELG
ncbi:MAG: GNAT family N-acetyltransferase [Saprospiraceae bacterium]|nr:GNAT family N-acetyltransferase [Saprospiraceae bacterium]